ncbi:unnamed protein product [Callosobruchus maculatus]|uniref:Reverse transcriptase domain-containing protein n=1 Tax=Callosobruchus maculatus TaxID=64391 RepID=A0A653C5D9_CALMS|nr:unnamed protein product [Callosobruchus maculatus]
MSLHPNQHSYTPGRSSDLALHQVVGRIERSLDNKEPTLRVFIDIKGAFDKTTCPKIGQQLQASNERRTVSECILRMFSNRAITIMVEDISVENGIKHPDRILLVNNQTRISLKKDHTVYASRKRVAGHASVIMTVARCASKSKKPEYTAVVAKMAQRCTLEITFANVYLNVRQFLIVVTSHSTAALFNHPPRRLIVIGRNRWCENMGLQTTILLLCWNYLLSYGYASYFGMVSKHVLRFSAVVNIFKEEKNLINQRENAAESDNEEDIVFDSQLSISVTSIHYKNQYSTLIYTYMREIEEFIHQKYILLKKRNSR